MKKIFVLTLVAYAATLFASNDCYTELTNKDNYSNLNTILKCMDKKIVNLEQQIKKLEQVKNSPKSANMLGYTKIPSTPEEGKPFSPPLQKTLLLCDEPFYFTYNGFYNKEENRISYRVNKSPSTAYPGNSKDFKGNNENLFLIFMQMSDDGKNPIFMYRCKKK